MTTIEFIARYKGNHVIVSVNEDKKILKIKHEKLPWCLELSDEELREYENEIDWLIDYALDDHRKDLAEYGQV